MDLTPDDLQREILNSVNRILERKCEPQRTRAILERGDYDWELHQELANAGFFDLPLTGAGPLEAAMVAVEISAHAGLVAASATGLVFPMVTGRAAPGPVALAAGAGAQFRLGQFAKAILILDGVQALLLEPTSADTEPVDNDRTSWPLARLTEGAISRAEVLGDGSADLLVAWWRTALAIDAAGAMRGAVAQTVRYVSERFQFGRPIGSFQAIQHRLAQITVQVEGAYWLAMEASYRGGDPLAAARAATWAAATAPLVLRETQQMHGAMGFTREYPLHLWTMRLPALQRELGGVNYHARAVASLRSTRQATNAPSDRQVA